MNGIGINFNATLGPTVERGLSRYFNVGGEVASTHHCVAAPPIRHESGQFKPVVKNPSFRRRGPGIVDLRACPTTRSSQLARWGRAAEILGHLRAVRQRPRRRFTPATARARRRAPPGRPDLDVEQLRPRVTSRALRRLAKDCRASDDAASTRHGDLPESAHRRAVAVRRAISTARPARSAVRRSARCSAQVSGAAYPRQVNPSDRRR
jgi:hypothetical protein